MNFFAESAFENISSKILRLREVSALQNRLIVTTSVFPSDVTLNLAKILDNFIKKDGQIDLTFKIAKNIGDEWRQSHDPNFNELKSREWIDASGNFASYRNANPSEGKLALIVLVGADKVTDASSLADFYRCDPNLVWQEQMNESFVPWIKKRLDLAHIGYDDKSLSNMDTILKGLEEQGCADLFRIASLLRDLTLEEHGIQDGNAAVRTLLGGLGTFHLPSFIGFKFSKNKKITPYIETAIRFFRYDLFLEERLKSKALKAIDDLLEEKIKEISENNFFRQEERGVFESDLSFVQAVKFYIQSEDEESRKMLRQSDFIAIYDKILKFKIKKISSPPKICKLSGGPIEMILTGIWRTFADFKKNYGNTRNDLKSITIQSDRFRHDNEGAPDNNHSSAAETQIHAKKYLQKLVGSVDRFISLNYIDISGFGDEDIHIHSHLYNDEVVCVHARTSEPLLEFTIMLSFEEKASFSRSFAWRLPETQTYRMAEELISWAASSIKSTATPILPAFHIRYHEELIRAKDDDETRRVLLHSIRDVASECTNLLTENWRQQNDPLLQYLRDLALAYRQFIESANEYGLHSVFHEGVDGKPAVWKMLLDAYVCASKAYFGEDVECKNSSMGAMLMRAFLMVEAREETNEAWVAEPFEPSGIATVLHPSVIEMLFAHINYLFACFNYAATLEWRSVNAKKAFPLSKWQDYLDLASIQMPLCGLIEDENRIINTHVTGQELIHRIGSPAKEEAPLSTRLLLRYEGFDDEDIADVEMFADTRESRLLENILSDYLAIHPHARDGISMAIYRNKDIQPIIAAIHWFLIKLSEGPTPILHKNRQRPYSFAITVFTEAGEDVGVARWIEQWKERWEAAESEAKYAAYRCCRFSIAHRVVPGNDTDRKSFARMIHDGLDVDIAILYDFIGAGLKGNDFQRVESYDVRERTLKFPITEKSFCIVDDPTHRLRRARVISNPQFRLSSFHLETMARLKNENIPYSQEHVLIGYGDFEPWQKVVTELHKRAEWVVCIDPSIDDILIKPKGDEHKKEREIIGFGSGVGLYGELNFTISTEHFDFSDICFRLEVAISELYPEWSTENLKVVAASVMKEAQTLSGLSIVRATGVGTYLHDFMAYALAGKLVATEDDLLCKHLISLDAYRHWFAHGDQKRPDLLWLKANLGEDGRIHLDMHLIECKLALKNDEHIEKAVLQIQNGFSTLISAFMPKAEKGGDDVRPDQRYWWLQLHRLLASKTRISRQRQDTIMAAMERLAEGDYTIAWHGAVLAFWTDINSPDLKKTGNASYVGLSNKSLQFGIYAIGSEAVLSLCTGQKEIRLDWDESSIQFGCNSVSKKKQKENIMETNNEAVDIPPCIYTDMIAGEIAQTQDVKNKNDITPAEIAYKIPDRILIGETVSGNRKVYWEFGHRELANRHLLVFGTSGMGKTYAVQCLLCEMGQQNQNSLVMDYTNGFLPNQLEAETQHILAPFQHIVRQAPLPISPFKLQVQELGLGFDIPESSIAAAKRIAGTFSQVYETLGDQQYSLLLDAIMLLIDNDNGFATLDGLIEALESFIDDGHHDKQKILTTISKLKPFVLEKPFSNTTTGLDWKGIFCDSEHRCHVFQFAGMDALSARLVIEFTLWDLNAFVRGTGNKNLPKVVVLDEAQNLDLTEQSPVAKYLTEGRKFGLSLILATQTMKNLQGDKLNRLFQAGHKLFFRPADTELQEHAKLLVQVTEGSTQSEWVSNLASLEKGQCYSVGPSLNTATGRLETKAFKIHVTSLGDRFSLG